MPFTPAHCAAALPFLGKRGRRVLDPVALVIGTTAPDFDYFLHGAMKGSGAHSALGIAFFALPITLLGWLAFHLFVARALWLSLPTSLRSRAPAPREPAALAQTPLVTVILGALVGATSHVVWDAFTHASGTGVALIPWLGTRLELPVIGRIRVYRLVQHASSLAGLGALLLVGLAWLRRRPAQAVPRLAPPLPLVVPASVVLGAVAGGGLGVVLRGSVEPRDVGHVAVAAIDGALVMGLLSTAALAALLTAVPRLVVAGPSRTAPPTG